MSNLCEDAKRFLIDGIPLRELPDKTRYFLYPLNKEDYNIIKGAIDKLREGLSKASYDVARTLRLEFKNLWGFDPFKEGAFIGSTKIKNEDDYKIIETLFETTEGKNKDTNSVSGGYQCFCHKNFKTSTYVPHRTIRSSWECMLIAYNNPPYALVLCHKVDENGKRIL